MLSVTAPESVEASVATARRWAEERAGQAEPPAARLLARVLAHPDGLSFTLDFVDGVLRPEDPGVAAGTGLYGQDPFRWESDLTLTRLKPDGTVYRDEDLERDVLQEWMACYGEPPRDAWAWAVLDDITHDYLEEEAHELERLHAA